MNKLKTKYKLLAMCRFEKFAFQIPHYAYPLALHKLKIKTT
jgi:hypothetical protein